MLSHKWKIVLPLAAIFMIFATAEASFANNASEKVQDLGKVEVTGSRLAEDITEVPAPAYVITKEEIDAIGARNLSEVLDRIPGVMGLTSASSSMARTQEVMIRGLASEILLLVDGVPFTNTYGMSGSNSFDLRTIPLDSIERIEVVKGASSALYGSAAAAGVINIISRKGSEKSTGFIKAEGGSGGFFRGTVRGTAVLSDDLRITAGYSKTQETGDINIRRLTKTTEPAQYDYGTNYDGNDYNFRVDKGAWSLVGEWGDFLSHYEYDKVPNWQKNDYARVSLNYSDGINTGRIYYRTDNKDS
ncbi:MAG: TonB-dependent receptor, partial [Synergistaceae bacterium]|nr:TonB-dependent receptor [Synergistaceae bacterium]